MNENLYWMWYLLIVHETGWNLDMLSTSIISQSLAEVFGDHNTLLNWCVLKIVELIHSKDSGTIECGAYLRDLPFFDQLLYRHYLYYLLLLPIIFTAFGSNLRIKINPDFMHFDSVLDCTKRNGRASARRARVCKNGYFWMTLQPKRGLWWPRKESELSKGLFMLRDFF